MRHLALVLGALCGLLAGNASAARIYVTTETPVDLYRCLFAPGGELLVGAARHGRRRRTWHCP